MFRGYHFPSLRDLQMMLSIMGFQAYPKYKRSLNVLSLSTLYKSIYVPHAQNMICILCGGFSSNISSSVRQLDVFVNCQVYRTNACFKASPHQRSFSRASCNNSHCLAKRVRFIRSASPLDSGVYSDKVVKSMPIFVSWILIAKTPCSCQGLPYLLYCLSYAPAT